MMRTGAAIAAVIVLGIGLLGVETSSAVEQAWRPASMAPGSTYVAWTQSGLRMPHFRPVAQGPRAVARDHRRTGALTPPRSLRSNRPHRGNAPVFARTMPHPRFERPGYPKAAGPQWRGSHRSPIRNAPGATPTVAGPGEWRRPAPGLLTNQRAPTTTRGPAPIGRHTTARQGAPVFAPAVAVNQRHAIDEARLPTVDVRQGRSVHPMSWRPSVRPDERRGVSPARPSVVRSTGHLGWPTGAATPSAYPGAPIAGRDARWRPTAPPVAPMRTLQSPFRPSPDRWLDVSMKRPPQPNAEPLHRRADSRPPGSMTTFRAPLGRARCVWCNGG